MYQILDLFFLTFHSALILFNLFGWVHRKLRKWHSISIGLTLASWTIMGYFYGWGYCICTDWHWQILREMGQAPLPHSYLSYLAQRILGVTPESSLMNSLAVIGIVVPLLLNGILTWKKRAGS